MKFNKMNKYLLVGIIFGFCFCNVGCAQRNVTSSDNSSASSGIRVNPVDFTYAAENTINAVIHISAEMQQKSSLFDLFFQDPFLNFFGQPQTRVYQAYGSGVILSSDGYIITNNHVVEGATKIKVTLNDKRTFEAAIVGTDEKNDLALLKVEAKNLHNIKYGNSDEVRLGEWVLAVGNPYNLTSTVTAGIVSAKARNLNILGGNTSVSSFIQTDAAVNSGNSGGALVNTAGELIGINAAIASNTGSFAGYSFAIPVNIVKKVVDDLMKYGRVQRVFFGASFSEMDGSKAENLHLNNAKGIQVFKIEPNKSADNAGIKEGDILLSINKHEVNSFSELKEILDQHIPGDVIVCKIIREQKELEIKVTLKNIIGTTDIIRKGDKVALQKLGIEVEPISDQIKARYRVNNGLHVTKIKDGLLKAAGIQNDFVITAIDKRSVATENDIERILEDKEGIIRIEGFYPNGYVYGYNIIM
ncbi:MAG: trypsin-like peptidase domain-containing protein [Bacteroidales bacterium]|jgi:Do/DeqQ family serine protease|nr:trypsin-like peptidase domain-containing protein [Bacteroidales bacterium]